MKKIAFIIPYFGVFPDFIKIWSLTVKYNETIDFHIYTDIDIPDYIKKIKNIIIHKITFIEMRRKIQKLYDFEISLKEPYKLCDYKPAYGEIFQEDLKMYDFWGYCDLDMVFGDIRKFITEELLNTYERIHALGFFSIYKNEKKINQIYKFQGEYPDQNYQDVFQTDESCYFDEYRGMFAKTLCSKTKLYKSHIHRNPRQNKYFFYELKCIPENRFVLEWNKGRLYSINVLTKEREEICYAHFFRRKFEINILKENFAELFSIFPNKIVLGTDVKDYMFEQKNNLLYEVKYYLDLINKRKNNLKNIFKKKKLEKDSNKYNYKLMIEYKDYLKDI